MKRVILEKLAILNFKKIENLTIDFNSGETNILGANESGKTTIYDAHSWLITGKESGDSSIFPIKKLSDSGEPVQNINVSVEAFYSIIDQDGSIEELVIKREFVENWGAERKGSSNIIFKGNTSAYYWNNVPLKTETEFVKRCSDIFISNEVFKLLTNPLFFASDSFEWKKRRAILEEIGGGEISDEYIMSVNPDLGEIIKLKSNKSLSDIRAEYKKTKSLLTDERDKNKTRIEEAKLSKKDDVDESEIDLQLSEAHLKIEDFDKKLSSLSERNKDKNDKKIKVQNEIYEIEKKNSEIYNAKRNEYSIERNNEYSEGSKIETDIKEIDIRINNGKATIKDVEESIESSKKYSQSRISDINNRLDELRDKYEVLDNSDFSDPDPEKVCNTCQCRPHPEDYSKNKSVMLKNFNIQKERDLAFIISSAEDLKKMISEEEIRISEVTKDKKKQIELYSEKVKDLVDQKSVFVEKLENLKNKVSTVISLEDRLIDTEYSSNLNKIEALRDELNSFDDDASGSGSELLEEKKELINLISSLNLKKQVNVDNKAVLDRIEFIKKSNKELGVKLSECDKILFNVDEYERIKYQELENRINIKFSLVRFKMFNKLQNGGYEPTCVPTFKGVPHVSGGINTAGRIISGVDIVNSLSDHYGLKLPVFIDNRESCTEIPRNDLQIINLFVSPADKKLRIGGDPKFLND